MVAQQALIRSSADPDELQPSQRARRERIVRTALRLLQTREYDEIQMRDIAERTGVAIGTVYRYFVSKEHLFAAVLLEWGSSLGQRIRKAPLKAATPEGQLIELLGRVLSAFEAKPQFLRMLIVVEITPDLHARALHQQFGANAHALFRETLSELEDDDAEAVLDVVQGVLGAMLRVWAIGLLPMDVVRQRLTRTIEIVFSPPPRLRSRAD